MKKRSKVADGLRFELRKDCSSPVFKTGAFNRSAIHPLRNESMIYDNLQFVNTFYLKAGSNEQKRTRKTNGSSRPVQFCPAE